MKIEIETCKGFTEWQLNQYSMEYEFMKEENVFLKRKVYIGLSHKRGSHAFYPCHANILSARGQAARQNKKIK